MFNELVRPGDGVSFIDHLSGRTLVSVTLKSVEFTAKGLTMCVETAAGPALQSRHEFRVAPHRLISFPDRTRGGSLGHVEFYDPQIDFASCSVPIVIHASDGVSIHVEHAETSVSEQS
jgi:hypothetical protein